MIQKNKIIYVFTFLSIIIIILGLIISHLVNKRVKQIDYSPIIKELENRLTNERKAIEDTIIKYNEIIEKNKIDLIKLEVKLKKQDAKLQTIKEFYDNKNTNINKLSADDVVRESREQLSE